MWRQSTADIFFLDWEPPLPDAPVKGRGARPDVGGGRVSVWRTILVANEWSEMQTLRKTDIRFTLFWMAFFLLGVNLVYSATQQPNLADKSVGSLNIVLRFANTTFWWLIISTGQYLWKFLIYERFFAESPEQIFIDMCTLAKVCLSPLSIYIYLHLNLFGLVPTPPNNTLMHAGIDFSNGRTIPRLVSALSLASPACRWIHG